MDELIRPNWHIALVHFPIALLVIGTFIEVFSFLGWRRHSFRSAGRWMLLLGAILSVPAAFSGLYALADVVPDGLASLRESDPLAADRLWSHVLLTSLATGVSMAVVVTWIGCSDIWRQRLSLVFKLLLLAAMVGVLSGVHQGGEAVYSSSVGIEARGQVEVPDTLQAYADDSTWSTLMGGAEQPHVVMAGLLMAVACVALGWSIRAIAQDDDPDITEEAQTASRIAAAFAAESGDLKTLLEHEAARSSTHHTPPVRATWIWMLAFGLGLVTIGGGLWILAQNTGWQPAELWKAINEGEYRWTRRLVHLIAGVVIVFCTLMLGILARFGRKSRLGLVLFAPPLLLAMALQVWVGVLLMLDSPEGPITGFQP